MKDPVEELVTFCIDNKLWFASDKYKEEFWVEMFMKYPHLKEKLKNQ